MVNTFTPTESRLLAVLADGQPHSRRELHACLPDDLGALSNIQPHLTVLRRRLRLRGEDIVCELNTNGHPGIRYRHVRLLVNTTDNSGS